MIEVGHFAILGTWDETPCPQGRLEIRMPPLGHVCGGGWAEYTQAALLALPMLVTHGCSFADIGAGSGILSVAAKRLGADYCVAVEVERDALKALREVFRVNDVQVRVKEDLPKTEVDLAVVSIGDSWWAENQDRVLAKRVLLVKNDMTTEVITR